MMKRTAILAAAVSMLIAFSSCGDMQVSLTTAEEAQTTSASPTTQKAEEIHPIFAITESPDATSTGWENAYVSFLADVPQLGGTADEFALFDLDGNGVPEMICCRGINYLPVGYSNSAAEALTAEGITVHDTLYFSESDGCIGIENSMTNSDGAFSFCEEFRLTSDSWSFVNEFSSLTLPGASEDDALFYERTAECPGKCDDVFCEHYSPVSREEYSSFIEDFESRYTEIGFVEFNPSEINSSNIANYIVR